ncbi:MAG: metallophosphoesterase [Methanomicrobia archaeon]|nr:metallophosphoesterase [Methanomicrobia archaeon]
MKIVHLSDIHAGGSHFLPDLAENVIDTINKLKPDILVVTGDLTDNGYTSEFEEAKGYIERLACDLKVIIPGNHDAKNVGYLGFEEFFGALVKVERSEGITVVGIDSTQPDLDEGHVGRELYAWLEQSLDTDDFKVVALHHHIIPVPKTGRERNILTDAGDVLELLMRYNVDLVLCGHRHVPWIWDLNGMIIANAGTACADRVKWGIPQSFNLFELEDAQKGTIKIYRMYSGGGQELVFDEERQRRAK